MSHKRDVFPRLAQVACSPALDMHLVKFSLIFSFTLRVRRAVLDRARSKTHAKARENSCMDERDWFFLARTLHTYLQTLFDK